MTRSFRNPRRRWQPFRRAALWLAARGVGGEPVAIGGMILGILAGVSFMATGEHESPRALWLLGAVCCLLRLVCLRLDAALQRIAPSPPGEESFFTELPERVSDAVTLIGFGFALDSDPWLGLGAALGAILSAYVRSVGYSRGAGEQSSRGPMARVHRLSLLSVAGVLMAAELPPETFAVPLPRIALWVILVGCLLTVLLRWLDIKKLR